MPPGTTRRVGKDVVNYCRPEQPARAVERKSDPILRRVGHDNSVRDEPGGLEVARARWRRAALRFKLALVKHALALRRKANFNPDQPRVPAGNPGGGQWTSEGGEGSGRVRLAAGGRPGLGRGAVVAILTELAKRAIEAYRSKEGLWDLFRNKMGSAAATTVDDETIVGVNSTSPAYEPIDGIERNRLIDRYAEVHPEHAEKAMLRQMPVNAFTHAETTVLLRAARKYGGTLAGRTLEVFGEDRLCNNCEEILPFVGQELGNPTVTFFDPRGEVGTIRDGKFYRAKKR
jgi:hypothetical protein